MTAAGRAPVTSTYLGVAAALESLGAERDSLAAQIKNDLFNAEFNDTPIPRGSSELAHCTDVLRSADRLAAGH